MRDDGGDVARVQLGFAEETGVKVDGTLYSDSLTDENGPVPTYIAMVKHNIKVQRACPLRGGAPAADGAYPRVQA
jgi:hypothetical protein